MSKLSASVFALVVVLSTLVIPLGDAEAETLGTNTIYVPVTSNGSPVSTGVTVTLTNVHTGGVLVAEFSSDMKLYVVDNAPSGYYRIDVVAEDHYDALNVAELPFTGLTSKTISPAISLTEFPTKQWEWNVTVRNPSTGLTITGAEVLFYDMANREVVSSATTNALGWASLDMWDTGVSANFALVVKANLYEMNVMQPVSVTSDDALVVNMTRSVRVSGFITDSEGGPASNVIAYLLCQDDSVPWIKRLLRSEEGTFFTFDAYPGDFTLCVDADGASAEIMPLDLTLETPGSIHDESMQLNDQVQDRDDVAIVYGGDYKSFVLSESVVWPFDEAYPGLDYSDVGSLRMQIDLNSAVPDGMVDVSEAASFVNKVEGFGAKYITTSQMLIVNETYFYMADDTLSSFALDLGAASVLDRGSVNYSYSCAYTVHEEDGEEMDVGADDYTAWLFAAYDTASMNRTYSVTLPTGYELVDNSSGDPSSHVVVSGYETFVVDPEEYIGGPEAVSLAFEASQGPSAVASMEAEQGLVYVVKDDGGNVTGYIVRVGSEVNFSAKDSEDPNRNPMIYTWSFGDGSENVTTANKTVGHNYTSAAANYTVNLTVTDSVGLVNWTEIYVLADGMDPDPEISIKDLEVNETSGELEVDQGQAVWFNATSSTDDAVTTGDSLGTIDFFEFQYGDGNESGRVYWTDDEKNVTHAFAESGTYEVVLNVTDVAGHWKNTTLTVKVNDSAAPSVSFVVKNATYGTSLIENETIILDANATDDNLDEKEDMYFVWYFADDLGADSWLNGTGLWNVTHVFTKVGTFSVELNVTDTSNNSAFIKRAVKIDPSARPDVQFDGSPYYEPAEFTEGDQGLIIINLTNKGSAVATGVVVSVYIVGGDQDTLIGSTSELWNGTVPVVQIDIGETVQVRFKWTPDKQGTYKLKLNVTSNNQLTVDTYTTRADESLVVKEAPWKKAALWGGIAAVIILVPLLLYLRGRWSRRERRGPRRDRGKSLDKAEMKERKEKEKRERKERKREQKEKQRQEKE
ncbi:MAG: PKD domain-containing protein [Methanobacteriota archaeon]|nr:MAG: PKD domain-containing protein [Euryarchaeota archaeon]